MPYSVAHLFVGFQWFGGPVGSILCKTINFSQTVSIAASVITLIVITVDRFVSIVFIWKTCLNLRTSKVSLVVIWIIAIGIMGLQLKVYTVRQAIPGDERYFCYPDWQGMPVGLNKFFAIGIFVMLYALPLLLMAILYSMIVQKLWKDSFAGSSASGGDANINSAKKRVVKMLLSVTVAFAVCWFPLHTMHYYIYFETETYNCMSPFLTLLSFWLGHANSAINPALYVTFNKTFRRAFLQALHIESYASLNSSGKKRSDKQFTTSHTHVRSTFRSGNKNEENIPFSPPSPNTRSLKEMYAYGKLVQPKENSTSKSLDSSSDGGKTKRHSIMIIMDKMTTV